mmetsp:Transcript_29608/g.87903  ORF Transcript_29608/g.87903 Transcript_29608/m.87903 type:complete len:221 (+) Transcript_29608:132-794(+)
MSVARRWETTRSVVPSGSRRRAACTKASVVASTREVASSTARILHRRATARATPRSCRSPSEKPAPRARTSRSRDHLSRPTVTRACRIFSSSSSPSGSMLSRTVPSKRKSSCGMAAMALRSLRSPMALTSSPPTRMAPSSGSTTRSRARRRLLLPLPVAPTMPMRSPARIFRVQDFSAFSQPSRYRMETPSNSTEPSLGQDSPGSPGSCRGASRRVSSVL